MEEKELNPLPITSNDVAASSLMDFEDEIQIPEFDATITLTE